MKLRLQQNLVEGFIITRGEHSWKKLQPEVTSLNRKSNPQTGSEAILGLRKLRLPRNLAECLRLTHRELRRPELQPEVIFLTGSDIIKQEVRLFLASESSDR